MSKNKYNNPIVIQRADPCIYKHIDGYYYFTASVPAFDSIELRRAKTIAELQDAETTTIWEKQWKMVYIFCSSTKSRSHRNYF